MLHLVQDYIKSILPAKRKTSPEGWQSFNAVCCVHNGETVDTRGRGGIHANADGSVSYHCFNCQFKASYQPGRHLSFKFRKLLKWLGAEDSEIKRLVIEAIRVKELIGAVEPTVEVEEKIEFKPRDLPEGAVSFSELGTFYQLAIGTAPMPIHITDAINYVVDREIALDKYDFYITDSTEYNMHKRIIIPCIWENKVIGYTSRSVHNDIKPKYHSHYEPNFVFNTNNQLLDSKFVIVCEGPFDAMSIGGVAVLGNTVSEVQADIIDSLARQVIVVPDFDQKDNKWSGELLVNAAQEYGWNVSFPIWRETCKDINAAVVKYGKLFVLKDILGSVETSKLKIELMRKKLHN